MLIDLTDKVIILDEAHNMEDSAREAASLSVNHIQISEVLKEITELCMLIEPESFFFYLCSFFFYLCMYCIYCSVPGEHPWALKHN